MLIQRKSCIVSRSSQAQSVRLKRSAEMSLVHVEVERNINIAVERMHKKMYKMF